MCSQMKASGKETSEVLSSSLDRNLFRRCVAREVSLGHVTEADVEGVPLLVFRRLDPTAVATHVTAHEELKVQLQEKKQQALMKSPPHSGGDLVGGIEVAAVSTALATSLNGLIPFGRRLASLWALSGVETVERRWWESLRRQEELVMKWAN